MKKLIAFILMTVLVFSLCACGAKNEEPEETGKEPVKQTSAAVEKEAETKEAETAAPAVTEAAKIPETEPQTTASKEFSADGKYTAFATESQGMCVSPTLLNLSAELTLKSDGTGTLHLVNGNETAAEGDVTWEIEGDKLTLTADGESITGTFKDGIITVDFAAGTVIYFAQEGADTSVVKVMSAEEFIKAMSGADESKEDGTDLGGVDNESFTTDTGKTARDLAKELNLYSDDTHYVMELYGVLICYEHEGDKITGCKAYIDAQSEAAAAYAEANSQDSDPTIESVKSMGNVIEITYAPSAYSALSVSTLDMVFPNSKIEK